jgi:hypothetical protein
MDTRVSAQQNKAIQHCQVPINNVDLQAP